MWHKIIKILNDMRKLSDFPAANCAANTLTFAPMGIFFATDFLSGGMLREESLQYFDGKIPGYIGLATYLASLNYNLYETAKLHPKAIKTQKSKNIQHNKVITTLHSLRINKKETRAFLEGPCKFEEETISKLLDAEITNRPQPNTANVIDTSNTKELLQLYDHFENIYFTKHPEKLNFLKYIYIYFNALMHGIPGLNIPILFKYFAGIDVIRSDQLTAEKIIGLIFLILSVYSIYQAINFNFQHKTPTSNDILIDVSDGFGFFQEQQDRELTEVKDERTPLLQQVVAQEMPNASEEESKEETELTILIRKRAGADSKATCCLARHGM